MVEAGTTSEVDPSDLNGHPSMEYQQPNMMMQSPESPYQYVTETLKPETVDDERNDSGIDCCPSVSPESGRSKTSSYSSASPTLDFGDENAADFDFQTISVPQFNSHGKAKTYRCKECKFLTDIKLKHWQHLETHMDPEKVLRCPQCPFVTEYKHHWEYHLLNHAGSKPFKCDVCEYSCVSKSMLTSHLKSHSKIYQYHCANCSYVTKYIHSLKQHCKKYTHEAGTVLNPDGTPNPVPVIDIYGTRRGPRTRRVNQPQARSVNQPAPPVNPVAQFQLPFAFMSSFPVPIASSEVLHNLQRYFQEKLQEWTVQNVPQPTEVGVLDLSKHADEMTTMFGNVEAVQEDKEIETIPIEDANRQECVQNKRHFSCQWCGIFFGDEIMYKMHMGYHRFSDPFTCNMCGEKCNNKVNFFVHIAKVAHQDSGRSYSLPNGIGIFG